MAVTAERSNKKKASKRTKKFQSKHLKGELERRKKTKKVKKVTNKSASSETSATSENHKLETEEQVFKQEKKNKSKNIGDVDADEFLEETFFNEMGSDNDEDEKESDSEMDDEDIEADLEAEIDQHKKELEELKKSDPSFAKFLEKEDKHLLEFGSTEEDINLENDGAFKGINEITEKAVRKRTQIPAITSAMVNKWKKELVDKKIIESSEKASIGIPTLLLSHRTRINE